MTPALALAVCSNHPDTPAAFACTRCGAFACEGCRAGFGEEQCAACAARTQGARKLEIGEALEAGVRVLSRRPGQALALVGLQVAVTMALYPLTADLNQQLETAGAAAAEAMLEGLPRLGLSGLLGYLLSTLLYAAYIHFEADVAAGRERPLSQVFRAALPAFLPLLGCAIVATLVFTAGFVACILPGLFLLTALLFCMHAVVLGGAGPIASLSASWRLTQGRRLAVGGLLAAAGVLGMVLLFLSMGAGYLLMPVGGRALSQALTSAASGLYILFFCGAFGEAYRQLGGAQTPR